MALTDDAEAEDHHVDALDDAMDKELIDAGATVSSNADLMADPVKLDPFKVGDWINNGHGRYGEKYDCALRDTGLALSTLHQFASGCSAIPGSVPQQKINV